METHYKRHLKKIGVKVDEALTRPCSNVTINEGDKKGIIDSSFIDLSLYNYTNSDVDIFDSVHSSM